MLVHDASYISLGVAITRNLSSFQVHAFNQCKGSVGKSHISMNVLLLKQMNNPRLHDVHTPGRLGFTTVKILECVLVMRTKWWYLILAWNNPASITDNPIFNTEIILQGHQVKNSFRNTRHRKGILRLLQIKQWANANKICICILCSKKKTLA